MRADSRATWTSGEPVSFGTRPYSAMILPVCSAVRDMCISSFENADAELVQRHPSMKLHKLRRLNVKLSNKLAIVARAGVRQQERKMAPFRSEERRVGKE